MQGINSLRSSFIDACNPDEPLLNDYQTLFDSLLNQTILILESQQQQIGNINDTPRGNIATSSVGDDIFFNAFDNAVQSSCNNNNGKLGFFQISALNNEDRDYPEQTVHTINPNTSRFDDYKQSPITQYSNEIQSQNSNYSSTFPISSPAYPAPAPLALFPKMHTQRKRSRVTFQTQEEEDCDNISFEMMASKVYVLSPVTSDDESTIAESEQVYTNKISSINKTKQNRHYIGVTYHATSNRYRARIKINNKTTHLGYFETDHEAALAYDRAAYELRGVRAHLNFKDNEFDFLQPVSKQLKVGEEMPIRMRCIVAAKSVLGKDSCLNTRELLNINN